MEFSPEAFNTVRTFSLDAFLKKKLCLLHDLKNCLTATLDVQQNFMTTKILSIGYLR